MQVIAWEKIEEKCNKCWYKHKKLQTNEYGTKFKICPNCFRQEIIPDEKDL